MQPKQNRHFLSIPLITFSCDSYVNDLGIKSDSFLTYFEATNQ